jgi:hypothetical protein
MSNPAVLLAGGLAVLVQPAADRSVQRTGTAPDSAGRSTVWGSI